MPIPLSQDIQEHVEALAESILARQYELQPELHTRFSAADRVQACQRTAQNLLFLAQALDLESALLFTDYINWLKIFMETRGQPVRDLRISLHCMQQILSQRYSREEAEALADYLDVARAELEKTMLGFYASGLRGEYSDRARRYLQALLGGNRAGAQDEIQAALAGGLALRDVYLGIFQPVLQEIGRMWQYNQVSAEQEGFASAVTGELMASLAPGKPGDDQCPRLAVLCPGGEPHNLGLRMLADLFALQGWSVCLPETSLADEELGRWAAAQRPHLVAISATMPTNIGRVTALIEVLRGEAPEAKILVGGYPFNLVPNLWRRVGADGYAPDAGAALRLAEEMREIS